MTALRSAMTIFGALVAAPLILAVVTLVSVVIASSTGSDVHVPGLVDALAGSGSGSDLATLRFDGAGVLVWVGAVAGALIVAEAVRRRFLRWNRRAR